MLRDEAKLPSFKNEPSDEDESLTQRSPAEGEDHDLKASLSQPSSDDELMPSSTDQHVLAKPYAPVTQNVKHKKIKPLNAYKSFVTRRLDQSKSSYLQHLERHGKRLAANAKRRKLATQDEKSALCSDSSSSSDDMPIEDDLTDVVDWHNLARGYGTDYLLLDALPVWEVSSLVGWATHLTQDNDNSPIAGEGAEASNGSASSLPFNPLRGLVNTPLPFSNLEYIANVARKEVLNFDEFLKLLGRFDQSALVAVGVVLEEMLTTSLLPLAKAHVQACREEECKLSSETTETSELEKMGKSEEAARPDEAFSFEQQNGRQLQEELVTPLPHAMDLQRAAKIAAEDLFHRRTLPPEEAIFRLIQDRKVDSTMGLPSLYTPTRTLCEDRTAKPGHITAKIWCRQHNLKTDYVQNNMDIFSAFLPVAPNPVVARKNELNDGRI
jgi:hypothetical protein